MQNRDRTPVPANLPAAAPLPSLSNALSRRAVIFGALTVGTASAASLPALASTPVVDPADARLVALANELEALERACDALPSIAIEDPDFDDMAAGFDPLEEEMADTPANTLAGVLAKIRALDGPTTGAYGNPNCHNILVSITEDITRLHAAGSLHV